jgi:polyphosphate kinase
MTLDKLNGSESEVPGRVNEIISDHQNRYGRVLVRSIIPALKKNGIELLYDKEIPASIYTQVSDIFFVKVAGYLHVVRLSDGSEFFPENNKIYFAVTFRESDDLFIVNIPSDSLRRFHTVTASDKTYVLMIDDIIRQHLPALFGLGKVSEADAFKITRDAELNLKDEVAGTITVRLEKLLAKRDYGFATRVLYDAVMPEGILNRLIGSLKLRAATRVAGGRYHNLRDLFSFPLSDHKFCYPEQRPIAVHIRDEGSVYSLIDRGDVMLHTPYHSYDLVLRFFNESAIDPYVEKIYVTLYRIAVDSAIAQALMTAARNGKKVTVLVELKARFDEANNIRWAKKMKAAGVSIYYSSPSMKVHAKISWVKRRRVDKKAGYYGIFATGNFNENTARLYTDHILLTSHPGMLREVRSLCKVLVKGRKLLASKVMNFTHLIVAPFNIRERFFDLVDREIDNARQGRRAAITIKLNNLEEETLIDKLYEASSAGVRIELIVRSICRLVPQVQGLSENIVIKRIVDRYLEHGRIFMFHNGGQDEVFCGSADWMNRNIYHRVEVCFPLYDARIREEIKGIIGLQCSDTAQAVMIAMQEGGGPGLRNVPLTSSGKRMIRSQDAIYNKLVGVSSIPSASSEVEVR